MPDADEEELYRRACAIAQARGRASVSELQRALGLGYNSTCRLVERMDREGLTGPRPVMSWATGRLPSEPFGLIVSR